MTDLKDLNAYCDDVKVSLSEQAKRNLATLTSVSWVKFLKDNFTKEELMAVAHELHKEEKAKDFSFTEAPLWFQPIIDSPLTTNFTVKDEDK